MKLRGNIFIGTIIFLVYLFLFPRHMEKELTLIPEERKSIEKIHTYNDSKRLWRLFQAEGFQPQSRIFILAQGNDRIVYADEQWNILYLEIKREFAAFSNWLAIRKENYIQLEHTDKPQIIKINLSGLPIARGGELFIYDYFSGHIQLMNSETGQTVWNRQYISPVSVISHQKDTSLITFINGYLVLLDSEGKTILEYNLTGSQINPIYGAALSRDTSRIALLGGINPQKFLYMKRDGGHIKVINDFLSNTAHRSPAKIDFVREDAEQEEVLYAGVEQIFNFRRNSLEIIGMAGRPAVWIDTLPAQSLALLHNFRTSPQGKLASLQIVTKNNQKLFQIEVKSDNKSLSSSIGGRLFMLDSSVLDVVALRIW